MSETVNRELNVSLSTVLSAWHDPAARILNVDLLTVLIAIIAAMVDLRRRDCRVALGFCP